MGQINNQKILMASTKHLAPEIDYELNLVPKEFSNLFMKNGNELLVEIPKTLALLYYLPHCLKPYIQFANKHDYEWILFTDEAEPLKEFKIYDKD